MVGRAIPRTSWRGSSHGRLARAFGPHHRRLRARGQDFPEEYRMRSWGDGGGGPDDDEEGGDDGVM
jgi:hypothetical protein